MGPAAGAGPGDMRAKRLRLATSCAALVLAIGALPTHAVGSAGPPGPVPAGAPNGSPSADTAYVPGQVVVGVRGGRSTVVELPPSTSVTAAAASLPRDPGVRFAEPNYVATASLAPYDRGSSGQPGGWEADQWSFLGKPGGIRVTGAWDRLASRGAPGGRGVVVAVVDTGVAYASDGGEAISPDFDSREFVPGIDIVGGDSSPEDANGHGTHVGGTIAAQVTLDRPSLTPDYLTGIAYGASLMPVRVLDAEGAGSASDVASGILWAAKNGADVINLSLQFDPSVTSCAQVPTVCTAVRRAKRRGALVVAAAGNAATGTGSHGALFPGAAPGVLAVGATTQHGCLAAYSHYGGRTDIVAPGGGAPRPTTSRTECAADQAPVQQLTYACFPACGNDLSSFAIRPDIGTSMAAAHTSAVAALVIASRAAGRDPSPHRLEKRIECTARPVSPEQLYGWGLLDAERATDPKRDCDQPRRR